MAQVPYPDLALRPVTVGAAAAADIAAIAAVAAAAGADNIACGVFARGDVSVLAVLGDEKTGVVRCSLTL